MTPGHPPVVPINGSLTNYASCRYQVTLASSRATISPRPRLSAAWGFSKEWFVLNSGFALSELLARRLYVEEILARFCGRRSRRSGGRRGRDVAHERNRTRA